MLPISSQRYCSHSRSPAGGCHGLQSYRRHAAGSQISTMMTTLNRGSVLSLRDRREACRQGASMMRGRRMVALSSSPLSSSSSSSPPHTPGDGEASMPETKQREALKAELRQTITRLNSGSPSRSDSEALTNLIRKLSLISPVRDTALSPLLDGRWALIYTTNGPTSQTPATRTPAGDGDQGGASGGLASALPFLQAVSDSAYQFFYRYVPVLAGSAVRNRGASSIGSSGGLKSRGNFQEFDLARGTVSNHARFSAFGRDCEINIGGGIAPVRQGPQTASTPVVRIKATFTDGEFVIGTGIGSTRLPIPLSWLSPVGFVDTPYLDQDLRISIGDKGSIFIATRA